MNVSTLLRASAFALLVVVLAVVAEQREKLTTDFPSFYAASGSLAQGHNPYDIRQLESFAGERGIDRVVYPYLYPPFLASVITPLTSLAPEGADRVWGAMMVVLFALSAVLVTLVPPTNPGESGWMARPVPGLLLAVAILLLLPLAENVRVGQVNALVMVCLTIAILGLEREGRAWQHAAGVALAIAVLVKVTPALLVLLLLARGKTTAVWTFLAACAGGIAVSVAISGAHVWGQFLAFLPAMSYGKGIVGMFHPIIISNFSISAFVMRLAQGAGPAVRLVSIVAALTLLGALLWVMRRHRKSEGRHGVLLAALVVMVVVSPYSWFHHLVFLYPGLVLMFRDLFSRAGQRQGWLMRALCTLLLLGVVVNFPVLYQHIAIPEAIRPVATSMNLFMLMGLFAAALQWARQGSGASRTVSCPVERWPRRLRVFLPLAARAR